MPELRRVLLVLAVAWLAAPGRPLPAGEAAPPKPADAPEVRELPAAPEDKPPTRTEEVEFSAATMLPPRQDGAVIMSGSAWVAARGMLLEAEHIVVWPKKRQAYAEGGVRLTEKGGRLLADEIFYDFGVHRGRARNVRLEAGRVEEVPAEPPAVPAPPKGEKPPAASGGSSKLGLPRETPRKWYVTAPEIRRAGPGSWQVLRPAISNCEFEKPHWRFEASSANYYPGDRVESFNNVLYVRSIPVFYFPYIARDLAHDYPWTFWSFGQNHEWGAHVLTKWGLALPHEPGWPVQPEHLILDADWRQRRGWGYGAEVRYDVLPHGGGRFESYFLDENRISRDDDLERALDDLARRQAIYASLLLTGGPKVIGQPKRLFEENVLFVERRALDGVDPPDLTPRLHRDENRFRLAWEHRQDFFPVRDGLHEKPVYGLDYSAEFVDFSDRDFQAEYFRDEYRRAPPAISYALLRRQADGYSLGLLAAPRLDQFQTQTEYLPQFRSDLLPQRLPGGFFVSGSGDFGKLNRRFDEDSGFRDFEAARAHGRVLVGRPVQLGPVGFNPYVGTDQAWYSDSRDDRSDELTRGALLYGADASTRFYGSFEAENGLLDIHRLRHVIEPRIFYRGVSRPTHSPRDILDFDAVDDLAKSDVTGAGLFQKLQTKRLGPDGAERTVDLAGLDLSASGYVDPDEARRLNDGDRMLPYKVNSFVSPVNNLRLWSNLEIDARGVGVTRSTEGATYAWPGLLVASAGFTTVHADRARNIAPSQYLSAALELNLSDHWRFAGASAYELEQPDPLLGRRGWSDTRLSLIRDLHCWLVSVDYFIPRPGEVNRSRTFGFSVAPAGAPVNLLKDSGRLLLPAEPDYSRQPWLFRPGEVPGELRVVPPEVPAAAP